MVGCFLIGTESNLLLVTQRQPSSPTAVQYHAQGVLTIHGQVCDLKGTDLPE